MCRFAAHNSQKIIAVSNFTRSEIIGRLLIDEKRVVVIHHGVSHTSESNRHDHGPPFLLFIGTHEERKGVTTLIHAYNLLRQQKRIPHRLVCVGKRGFGWRDIQAAYDASPFRAHIELRGYASRDEILRLYQTADLFIYPSVYEGFGLPILEAMACGTPVVCTRAASLPEVAGDAAEYFETSSVEDLAGAIERVLKSREKWAALRERGLERVKMFSWDECARRHCAVYREVAEARKNQTAACTS
jgi:glycosyltransferase involved in cell wall biosynthesis